MSEPNLFIIVLNEAIKKGLDALGKPLSSFRSINALVDAISPSDVSTLQLDTLFVTNHMTKAEAWFCEDGVTSEGFAVTAAGENVSSDVLSTMGRLCAHAIDGSQLVLYVNGSTGDADTLENMATALAKHVPVNKNLGWQMLAKL